jgi:hypothetical protein
VGEARQRSLNRQQLLAGETRCIYCAHAAETLEHMPPKSLFKQKLRPHGYEFAACKTCNDCTRVADALVGILARMAPTDSLGEQWQLDEAYKLIGPVAKRSKKLIVEIFGEGDRGKGWFKHNGLLHPVRHLTLDGPAVSASMPAFGAKLGFALFRQHIGKPMPIGGGVFSRHFLNIGPSESAAKAWLSILPDFQEMTQDQWASGKQFAYRFNTDQNSIVAAYVSLHDLVTYWVIAVSDSNLYRNGLHAKDFFRFVELGELENLSRQWLDA